MWLEFKFFSMIEQLLIQLNILWLLNTQIIGFMHKKEETQIPKAAA